MATLVTGLGYIGAALARRLLLEGEAVIGVENFFSTPISPIERLCREDGLILVEGSVADPTTLRRAFEAARIDTVFHLAAQASAHPEAATFEVTERSNFLGTRLVLEACADRAIPTVVIASSTRLYAAPLPRQVSEHSPLRPRDVVHLSHLYGEILLARFRERGAATSWTALRLGTVHGVGPVMKTAIPFLAVPQRFCREAALGEPLHVSTGSDSVLALVHLDDVVEAFIHCRDHPVIDAVANVAAEVRSVAGIGTAVQQAARQRGLDVSLRRWGRAGPAPQRAISSALETSGFRPSRLIEDSIGEVLDYYLSVARSGR